MITNNPKHLHSNQSQTFTFESIITIYYYYYSNYLTEIQYLFMQRVILYPYILLLYLSYYHLHI